MTEFYLNIAKGFMEKRQYSYAKTALCKALGAANREGVNRSNIFKAMNHVRRVV